MRNNVTALVVVAMCAMLAGLLAPDMTWMVDEGPAIPGDGRSAALEPSRTWTADMTPSPESTGRPSAIHDEPTEDAILFYEDPANAGEWLQLPTSEDLVDGTVAPVSFENGSQYEIHGKLFEWIEDPQNVTYLDDIGIPNVTIRITFDGDLVLSDELTNDQTAQVDPFGAFGNGTFAFPLDVEKPAGEYELLTEFIAVPPAPPSAENCTHRTVVYVSHPCLPQVDISPSDLTVGDVLKISGSLADDTGRTIACVPLQIWFDDVLIGPSSDGVFIDDVSVEGAIFSDGFEADDANGWSVSVAHGTTDQWEHGSPGNGSGPSAAHSGSRVWGTDLDANYRRGAWSYLVTPRLDLSSEGPYTLSFWAWWSVYWSGDLAYVLASTDGGETWDEPGAMRFMGASLATADWTLVEYDVTKYRGSDDVRFAFVFYSVGKTLDVRTDGTFNYLHTIPMDTEAGVHDVLVAFEGNLLFRAGDVRTSIVVKRTTHFEFEPLTMAKIGFRNQTIYLTAKLLDNMGEVPKANVSGIICSYQVTVRWDPTWTKTDDDDVTVDPPGVMDPDTGEVSCGYIVGRDQTLGPANVTFEFEGSDFYTAVSMVDIYYVQANTYVRLPDGEQLHGHRGQILLIRGELRVVPDQSVVDRELGDPIGGEFVTVFWGPERIDVRRTQYNGTFDADYLVPSDHALGDVLVTFEYKGQVLYEPFNHSINCTITSETVITLEDQTVHKGEWVWINGTIEDDMGQPIAGATITILWGSGGLQQKAQVDSGPDGRFAHEHFVEFETRIGNVTVVARYEGISPLLDGEASATFTVKVGTILLRHDRVMSVIRGETAEFSGRLFEDWGGTRGIEVQREKVGLLIDDILVKIKITAFDGSVTFTVPIDPKLYRYGEVPLVFEFPGSEFYDGSRNETGLVIKANSIVGFAELLVDGSILDPLSPIVHKGDVVYGRILVQDDDLQPIPDGNMSVCYKEEGLRARKHLIATGMTDSLGFFVFNWTPLNTTEGTVTIIAEYEGLTASTLLKVGDLIVLPSSGEYALTYQAPMDGDSDEVSISGDLSVGQGDTLSISVQPSDYFGWNSSSLVFSLESAPEGMEIAPDGTITWSASDVKAGTYDVRLKLADGRRCEYANFQVRVTEQGMGAGLGPVALGMALLLVAAVVIVIGLSWSRRRHSG